MKLLVTGGAGFIGSAFVRLALGEARDAHGIAGVTVLDKLTYAGNLENLEPVQSAAGYSFVRGDITSPEDVDAALAQAGADAIVHFAAESHVDRSIQSARPFVETNVGGTLTLLEGARRHGVKLFLHVSTDEVYGSMEPDQEADEHFPLKASSPYSASKAGSDLLALSFWHTHKLPVVVTRASNNYGPYQFPEKLIPLMISNALEGKPLPVYGDGQQVRDWLHVDDHCRAILAAVAKGTPGEVYNVGGTASLANLDVVRRILALTCQGEELIRFVTDRPGHDRRYALSCEKLHHATGWAPRVPFEDGLRDTIQWYKDHQGWVSRVKSGEYQRYYDSMYAGR